MRAEMSLSPQLPLPSQHRQLPVLLTILPALLHAILSAIRYSHPLNRCNGSQTRCCCLVFQASRST